MNKEDRKYIVLNWFGLLFPLTLVYIILTALRDFRDNFANELFREMHILNYWNIARGELTISIFVLILIGGFVLIKDHRKALSMIHMIIVGGFVIIIVDSILYRLGLISGTNWYFTMGIGIFSGYIPFNCILSDRLMSLIKSKGNAGFVMYWMDAFGYASVLIILYLKEFMTLHLSYLNFYIGLVFVTGFLGLLIILFSFFNSQKIILQNA